MAGAPLDFGTAGDLAATAAADYDADAIIETNAEEIAGLVEQGHEVSLTVLRPPTGAAVVYKLNNRDYRRSDGSVA